MSLPLMSGALGGRKRFVALAIAVLAVVAILWFAFFREPEQVKASIPALAVPEGQAGKAGEVLVTQEMERLRADVHQAEAHLHEAEAAVSRSQAELVAARENLKAAQKEQPLARREVEIRRSAVAREEKVYAGGHARNRELVQAETDARLARVEAEAAAVEQRPELEEARREAAAAEWQARLAGRAGAPDLQLSVYRSTLGNTAEQGVQLAVVVPLFDWGRLGAEHARDKKLAEARAHQVEVVRREVVSEARAAATRYRVAQERRQALSYQAAQYAELSRTSRKGYEIGLIGLVEVLDATQAYRESLSDYIKAEADFHRARVGLWWAAGRPLDQGRDE